MRPALLLFLLLALGPPLYLLVDALFVEGVFSLENYRVVLLDAGRKVAEHKVDADTDLLAHFRAERNAAAAS